MKAIKEKLTTQLKSLESAQKIISNDEDKNNMTWYKYDMKKRKAEGEHLQVIARIVRDKVSTLPNFYPHDTQALFEYLYAAKVPVNLRNQENNTLLHVACANGHIGVIKVLLSRGAKIEVINNHGLTPEQLADNYIQDILSLKNQAYDSFGKESIFIREIIKFESEYKAHLEKQLRRKQMTFIGWFLNNFILFQRQQKAQKLKKYIELARKEGDDSALVSHLRGELAEHNKAKGNDTGIFGTSMFFSSIEELLERVDENQDDYEYVRLSTNIRKATLYYRLQQAEINEMETAQKLNETALALEKEKEKNVNDKERFELIIKSYKEDMERQKDQELKNSQELANLSSLLDKQAIKHAEEMEALELRIMSKIAAKQSGANKPEALPEKGLAQAAGEHGIFVPPTNTPKSGNSNNIQIATEQRFT